LYIIGFSFYLYFSYRFIRYKLVFLEKKNALDWELDKVRRIKRLVKGLILLFGISATYIIGDFFTYHFIGMNLYNIRGFTYIGDLSFTLMVLWVSYYAFRNAFFPSRKRLKTSKEPAVLLAKIDTLFQEEKIYMDDELDRRKLGYYLKIRTSYLTKILPDTFRNILNKYRIEEAKKRLADKRYKNYSLESIGLDVGFKNKTAFLQTFKRIEQENPDTFRWEN
jgi:AraC-like DNA-binding protein